MLISSFLSCALLLVQSATCSDLQQDTPSVNEKSSKQLATDLNTDTYGYHHPPLPEVNEQKGSRKEKSLSIDEQTTTQRTYSRGFKPRARPRTGTTSSEIPVQVIYETTPATVPSTSHSTTSPLDKTTKVFIPRRQFHSNTIKKIDIIETTAAPNNIATENDREDVPTFMKKDEIYVSTTEVPRRLRGRLLNTKKKIEITEKTEATSTEKTEATSNIPTENNKDNVPKIVEKDINNVTTRKFQRRSRGRLSNANKIIVITEKPAETSNNPTENVTEDVPRITEKDSNDVTTKNFQMKSRGQLSNTNIEITEKPAKTSDIATKIVTEDVPTVTKKDYTKVSTTKFPTRSRGRHLNLNKKVDTGEATVTTNNIVTKNVTKDMPSFTEKDKTVVSTTAVSKRLSRRKLNTNKNIDIRETTAATINIASENVTEDIMVTLKEKDRGLLLTTEFPKKLRGSYYNTNKKIVIRQTSAATSEVPTENSTGDVPTLTKKGKSYVTTTEFPKRSRGSYFKKRTGIPTPKVKILEEKNFVYSHSGNFHYSYLGGDGTKISSEGSLKSYDNNKTGEAVSGSVFYKDKDGNDYSFSYTADENGYRPTGAHLPTPPPLPPAIARALKYIADKNKSTASPLAKSE